MTSALVEIRDVLPRLPLGFVTVTPRGKRFYAFRPADRPTAIKAAIAAIEIAASIDSEAVGWNDEDRAWVDLDIFITVDVNPASS